MGLPLHVDADYGEPSSWAEARQISIGALLDMEYRREKPALREAAEELVEQPLDEVAPPEAIWTQTTTRT